MAPINKQHDHRYVIAAGPLNSLASLTFFLSEPLHHLSQLYAEGKVVEPYFDLSEVEPRRQSMAALTAFLSIAERLSKYIGYPVPVLFNWNPAVLGFWHDIKFLSIARDNGCMAFPEELVGGYTTGSTNPNTRMIRYELNPADPQPSRNQVVPLRAWKDRNRLRLSNDLSFICQHVFNPPHSRARIDVQLVNTVSANAAELALNALMHGNAAAYVGLQRSPSAITVAVCDCGDGFPRSLSRHPLYSTGVMNKIPSDTQALLMGSLMNKSEMGLRRAISEITQSQDIEAGSVIMSSYAGEIQWREELWTHALASFDELLTDPSELDVVGLLGEAISGTPTHSTKHQGFHRTWKLGLRGTRVAFELKLRTEHA